jgi:N,N'-diacetyllegionaminate synthase
MPKTYVIAEAGVNHNGNLEEAYKLVDVGAKAGVDAVKFQSFKAENLVSKFAEKAGYQKETTGVDETQFAMLKKLELQEEEYRLLFDYCRKQGTTFLSSPFDLESADYLLELGMGIFKIPSGEITNLPYLRKIGGFGKKVILSTGMSVLGEIEEALAILIEAGTDRKDITLLHCSSEYPTPIQNVNLSAMLTLRDAFHLPVGYSDHTLGIEIPVAATALGAVVIEKHFTLDKNQAGPDHRASLEPSELKQMVTAIRNIEQAMGTGIKQLSITEKKNILTGRKSLVAKTDLHKGDVFNADNVAIKRPGTGLSPMKWDELMGRKASQNFKKDELLKG